jgi:hypothetical protein
VVQTVGFHEREEVVVEGHEYPDLTVPRPMAL